MWISHLNNYPKGIIKVYLYTHWVFKIIYSKYNACNCVQVERPESVYNFEK